MPKCQSRRKVTAHSAPDLLAADYFRVEDSYTNWRPHGTNDWLLIVTAGGAGRVGTGDTETTTTPGRITLFEPGTPQYYYTDPNTRTWQLFWSHFHPRPHWAPWLRWPEIDRGLRTVVLHDPVVMRQVLAGMKDATRLSRMLLPGSMDLAMNALERSLLWISSTNNQTILDERIRQAANWMAENLMKPISLETLAKVCGLSVSRLAHLFREQIGMSPLQYLEELRLQRAAQLLRSTGLRIQEIAEETGYGSAFYFSNRFRKKFACPPTQYRRRK